MPRHCLNWCRGEPVGIKGSCVLEYTKTIIDCFQANRDRLPSAPLNVAVQILSQEEVLISWQPPTKVCFSFFLSLTDFRFFFFFN